MRYTRALWMKWLWWWDAAGRHLWLSLRAILWPVDSTLVASSMANIPTFLPQMVLGLLPLTQVP